MKRIIALFLSIVMILTSFAALASCNNTPEQTTESTGSETTQTESGSTQTTETTETESGTSETNATETTEPATTETETDESEETTASEDQTACPHDLVHHEGQDPTCLGKGWAAYDTCAGCGYSSYTELAATGHDYSDNSDTCHNCGVFNMPTVYIT
ncbi:MAG: hypothetical protein IJC64_01370, partial [Clostridia bacterium]|nr:hypothetical protein [Clostridia bacterium]